MSAEATKKGTWAMARTARLNYGQKYAAISLSFLAGYERKQSCPEVKERRKFSW